MILIEKKFIKKKKIIKIKKKNGVTALTAADCFENSLKEDGEFLEFGL